MKNTISLRLYVAGQTKNSRLAVENLEKILADCHYELETIDVLADPERALDDGICVTPTLMRVSPQPLVTIIGSLKQRSEVRLALALDP